LRQLIVSTAKRIGLESKLRCNATLLDKILTTVIESREEQ